MMAVMANAMRLQAQRSAASLVVSRVGLVASYDPNNYCAKVTLDDQTTGWLPVASVWVGSGWGMFCPPSINDQVTVTFTEGDLNNGVVQARHFNNEDRPLSVPSGELWLVHARGAFFKLTNDKKLTFSDGQGAQMQFDGAGNIDSEANQWNHNGNVKVTGTLAATVDVTGGSNNVSLIGHTHPVAEIQTGSSTINSNAPNP